MKKYADSLAIKAWIMRERGKNNIEIGEVLGVTNSTISKWITRVNSQPVLLTKAKNEYQPNRQAIKISHNANITPIGEHTDEIEDNVIVDALNKAITKERKIRNRKGKPTKCSIIRKWIDTNPKGNRTDYIKDTGDEVTHSQFHCAKTYGVKEETAIIKRPVRKKASPQIILESITNQDKLIDENSFLRWWNLGERQGFVDRLLEELEKR
jgi:predicted transcriptional regulator